MLTKKCFDRCLGALLVFNQVPVNDTMNEMLYKLVSRDFEDEEFSSICGDICRTENLFGKYPIPKMFYDRKRQSDKKELIEQEVFYLDDSIPEYKPYLVGMTDKDMENCWWWIYKNHRGEMLGRLEIVEMIKQFNWHNLQSESDIPTLTEVKKLIDNHKGE